MGADLDWQPIKTAPQNTCVFVYRVDPEGGCDRVATAYQDKGGDWIGLPVLGPVSHSIGFEPTHWLTITGPEIPAMDKPGAGHTAEYEVTRDGRKAGLEARHV